MNATRTYTMLKTLTATEDQNIWTAELPTHGKIGLQGKRAGVRVWFRHLKVKQLD